ncbi:MAG: 2-C-methyl-D-erythritol 4-phosphate cytidylyltransferase [Bacteroidia bacterium]
MKHYAIIVAAGRGSRMQSPVPKQFLKLGGKPVLLHSLKAFINFDPNITLILVLPADQFAMWDKIKTEYHFQHPVLITAGGETRFDSVKNGLSMIEGQEGLVGIHDAVRPLVAVTTITAAYKSAEHYGSGVPAVPLNDSIRQIESSKNIAVDRSRFCLIQTPQCFRVDLLKQAYSCEYRYTFTDDASVVEANGGEIHLVDGNFDNFKLTTPTDLVIAEALVGRKVEG